MMVSGLGWVSRDENLGSIRARFSFFDEDMPINRKVFELLDLARGPVNREPINSCVSRQPKMEATGNLGAKTILGIEFSRLFEAARPHDHAGANSQAIAFGAAKRKVEIVSRRKLILEQQHRATTGLAHHQIHAAVIAKVTGHNRPTVSI